MGIKNPLGKLCYTRHKEGKARIKKPKHLEVVVLDLNDSLTYERFLAARMVCHPE